jgi:acid stress-induced BolA-like protein IbaG/YrbA
MFEVNVIAPEFKGLNTVKQHRIINEVEYLMCLKYIYKILHLFNI